MSVDDEEGLGPLPRLHERVATVSAASCALEMAILEWMKAHPDLTLGEHVRITGQVLSRHLEHFARQMIKRERHGARSRKRSDEA